MQHTKSHFSFHPGCMYSMAAFGPVLGFLQGAYLLSFHMDSFSSTTISIGKILKSTFNIVQSKIVKLFWRCC